MYTLVIWDILFIFSLFGMSEVQNLGGDIISVVLLVCSANSAMSGTIVSCSLKYWCMTDIIQDSAK